MGESLSAASEPLQSSLAAHEFRSVDPAQLRAGSRLRLPIYDYRDVMLLAGGGTISPSFLRHLQSRGVWIVKVHESDVPRVCLNGLQADDAIRARRGRGLLLPAGGGLGLPEQGEPLLCGADLRGVEPYDAGLKDRFVTNQTEAVEQMELVARALTRDRDMDMDVTSEVADEAMGDLVSDPDLFTGLGIGPAGTRYPVRHSTHTCMLALAMGMHLRLDRPTLKELAIGCLVHDAGMLQIDQRVLRKVGPLTRSDFLEITKHPSIVFDLLMDIPKIPKRAAFIAYQMHERSNGTGYPRRRDGSQIYFLSKIASVADTFVALVSPRPHRPGLLPYHAMETLIRGAHAGDFDPMIVRALLHTVSLFPIGSCVELSDGRLGRVIRTNGNAYHRPIIEIAEAPGGGGAPVVLDLLERSDLDVARPVKAAPVPAETEFEVIAAEQAAVAR